MNATNGTAVTVNMTKSATQTIAEMTTAIGTMTVATTIKIGAMTIANLNAGIFAKISPKIPA